MWNRGPCRFSIPPCETVIVLPRLNCRQFIEDWERSILQRIRPSSIVPFSKDIRVHSLVTLLRGVRLSSAPMGVE